MSLVKAMATVAGLTGISRVAGFIRDILTAVILGAGPISDAFFVALKLPNLFRRVTAEGAFSVSFVPIYTETMEKEGEEQAGIFASNTFAIMLWSLLGISLLVMFFMPYVIYLIAPGFHGDIMRYPAAVEMSQITFPYLLMMSLAALMGGMLNAHKRFAPFAAAPILFNLSLITFLLFSGFFKNAGYALSWGVFAAGILQCGLLWHYVQKAGITLKVKGVMPDIGDEKFKRLLKLMGPGVIGAGVMHINLLADMILASFLRPGSISFLYFGDRLNQLPLGIVGIAVGTALLPLLSRAVTAGDEKAAFNLFNRALEICLVLALPAAVGLFMAAQPIVMTLFQHGEFSYGDTQATSAVLMAYALGMPAYVATKVYSTAYWARQDTVSPVKASVVSTVFNIIVSILLITVAGIGVLGIAIGTALAGWLQIILLARGVRGRPENKLAKRLKRSILKIIFSCLAMGGFLYSVGMQLEGLYTDADTALLSQIGGLILLVGGGAAIYGAGVILTGVLNPKDFKKLLREPK